MTKRKVKIHLNKIAQEMLLGYLEGVDWSINLCVPNPNPKNSPVDDYLPMSEEEQDEILNKVLTWIDDYRKKYNGKFSVIEVDKELAYYLSADSSNQADLIQSEVLSTSNDAEDLYESYIAKNGREYDRIKENKKPLYEEYKLAHKQLTVLSNVDRHWRL